MICAELFALGNLVNFRIRPSLGCHFQELDKRSDILFVGVHDDPLCNGGKLHITTDAAVSGITKRRINLEPNQLVRKLGGTLDASFGPTIFNREVLPLDPTE